MHVSHGNFSKTILFWYDTCALRPFPWQLNKTMYSIWVSEIMLQQTQAQTVIPYYGRFLKKFASIAQLAQSELDEVLCLWSGLGYYSRAINLHKTAKIIIARYNGAFPEDFNILISLPGIGKSTAGAILSLTLDQHYAILDGNIKRILIRYYALDYYLSGNKSNVNKELWLLSTKLLPNKKVSIFNQAMMNLGRLVCTNRNPKCNFCPLQKGCQAFFRNSVSQYPKKKPKKIFLQKIIYLLLLKIYKYYTNMVWLEKRPIKMIWGGLFCFPEFKNVSMLDAWLVSVDLYHNPRRYLSILKYRLSNIDLIIQPVLVDMNKKLQYSHDGTWYDLIDPPNVGLPKPVSIILQNL
ncbi:A/G-specific adenine glycosylase [Candidatus Blochmannia ocreatus (nom. nud.)]|uniref:Adenine DNA glycosylase n=1 Tax=Candidatus Blochmannia ocreatus (nom. nud.) TaxID=251538 RepID=A0ABY4SWH9_9ENTR|nr:A/G-specific adenine glycosylase [Candidatus Blochmannia ocreatus]URJ25315.1 A/G-specific adenine glycosylase [Candidatus Blochmannia ocreatus]